MELSRILTDFFTETIWVAILFGGVAIVLIGYFWLAVRAVQASGWWRIGYIPPFAFFYLLSGSRRVLAPLILMAVGLTIAAAPIVITHYVLPLLPRHPWERNVDGELHVTLTNLDGFDYRTLEKRPEIVVLQMNNSHVDDQTLESLRRLTNLRELNLNDAAITDAGLVVIKELPKLEVLKLARTKISDDGFSQNLAPLDQLKSLDLRETAVKSATLRSWKKAKEGREFLK